MKLAVKLEWVSQEQSSHPFESAIMQMIVGIQQRHPQEMMDAYAIHLKSMKDHYLQWEEESNG